MSQPYDPQADDRLDAEDEHWSSPNGCHPDCPACEAEEELQRREDLTMDDWVEDVRQGNTKLGYEAWVEHNVESERDRILAERAAENRVKDAAPALLNALMRVLDLIPVSDQTPDESQIITNARYWRPAVEEANAAIAKTKPKN